MIHIIFLLTRYPINVLELKKPRRKRKLSNKKKTTFTEAEVKKLHQQTIKMAKIVIPSKGYDSKMAENNASGFPKWLKNAFEWKQIDETVFFHMITLFSEAQEKIMNIEPDKTQIFYNKLANYTALGVDKSLSKIKICLIQIIGMYLKYPFHH